MQKALPLSLLMLICVASALTPREVVSSVASDLDLTAQPTAACQEWEAASKDFTYPALSASQKKHIATFSFTQADSTGMELVKSMIDLITLKNNLKAVRPWSQNGKTALRIFTYSDTPKYTYSFGVTERAHPTNEFLQTTDVCITVEGLRS